MMNYELLADMVACFHALWAFGLILLFVINLFLAVFYEPVKKMIVLTIAMYITTFISKLMWMGCPLTILEGKLRNMNMAGFVFKDGSWTAQLLYNYFGIDISASFIIFTLVIGFIITLRFCFKNIDKFTMDNFLELFNND